jgi:hypothetical protein
MIRMGMRDDRAFHRAPRVDMEVARNTEKALGSRDDEIGRSVHVSFKDACTTAA